MSKIKNGGLDHDAKPFEQQQFGKAGADGVKHMQQKENCVNSPELIIIFRCISPDASEELHHVLTLTLTLAYTKTITLILPTLLLLNLLTLTLTGELRDKHRQKTFYEKSIATTWQARRSTNLQITHLSIIGHHFGSNVGNNSS